MKTVLKGLAWAIAMFVIVVADTIGAISESSTTTMLCVIPLLAVITMTGGKCCMRGRAGEARP